MLFKNYINKTKKIKTFIIYIEKMLEMIESHIL